MLLLFSCVTKREQSVFVYLFSSQNQPHRFSSPRELLFLSDGSLNMNCKAGGVRQCHSQTLILTHAAANVTYRLQEQTGRFIPRKTLDLYLMYLREKCLQLKHDEIGKSTPL